MQGSLAVPRAAAQKARLLHMSCRGSAGRPAESVTATLSARWLVPCLTHRLWSLLLVGTCQDMCLLGRISFSSVGSPLHFLICYNKGLFMTREYLTLWEICSFCFCPHRMFLSAPCEGTGNYRAIHLHPRNFRQIL